MLEWKVNQKIFDAIGTKTDLLGVHIPTDKIVHVTDDLITTIIKQFDDLEYIYVPAKSYCVALVYAHELVKDYGGTMIDYLSDNELLLNDIYFVPYNKDANTYNYFIEHAEWVDSPMAMRIKEYYLKEVHLEGLENGN